MAEKDIEKIPLKINECPKSLEDNDLGWKTQSHERYL